VSRFAKRLTKLQRRALRCWIHPDTAESHVPSSLSDLGACNIHKLRICRQ